MDPRTRVRLAFPSVAAVILLWACGSPPPAAKPADAAKPAAPAAAAPADVKAHMNAHFTNATDVHAAVVRGDIEAAKEHAKWIAEHQELAGLPPAGLGAIQEMKRAAKAVADASDVKAAAQGSAEMAAACGTCHAATNAKPTFPVVPAKPEPNATVAQMHAHQHAVDLLYHGLVAPSDEAWAEGAKALKAASMKPVQVPKTKSAKEAVLAEAETHAMADKALAAADPGARAAVYGDIVAGCASCHALYGMVLGEGLPKK